MIISMCGGTSDEGNEKNIISLSTTHTEIIQMLEAENQLIGVDSFSETELPIKKIDAYTVTADELLLLNPDIVIVAFDFNGIVEGFCLLYTSDAADDL